MTDTAEAITPKRMPRDSMLLMGMIKPVSAFAPEAQPVRVRNLSASGMMSDARPGYYIGCPVEVELRGIGIIAGEILWVRGNRMGVGFANAIDPKQARQPLMSHTGEWLRKVNGAKVRRPGLRID